MNPRYRTHLSGSKAFQSFIPPEIEDYNFIVSPNMKTKLDNLGRIFGELDSHLRTLSDDDVKRLVGLEARDSLRLASDVVSNPFAFNLAVDNTNEKAIVKATEYGAEAMDELPISGRLIRNIHYLVCEGADYDKKYRGDFRRSPVWIGRKGAGLTDAAFVPPVGEDMDRGIADLERHINYSDDNAFVKAAVAHYQFEMIHPFIDANGRVGRLLNTLILLQAGIISKPVLLLSHIIARDYNDYCERIQLVNTTSDIEIWVDYWLDILLQSSEYTTQVLTNYNP
uniref:Fic family protein n=1 Tax=Candidatus Limisoma sp. TaxID=3076476 RepID=UPI004028FA2F